MLEDVTSTFRWQEIKVHKMSALLQTIMQRKSSSHLEMKNLISIRKMSITSLNTGLNDHIVSIINGALYVFGIWNYSCY